MLKDASKPQCCVDVTGQIPADFPYYPGWPSLGSSTPYNEVSEFCCDPTRDTDVDEAYVVPRCNPRETNCAGPANCGGRITSSGPLSDGCCPYGGGGNHGGQDGSITNFINELCSDTDCRARITSTNTACHTDQDSDHNTGCAVDFQNISGCEAINEQSCNWEPDPGGSGHWHCNTCE